MTTVEVVVDEASGGANTVGAADVRVVAVVVFGIGMGQIRGCLGRSAQETALEVTDRATTEDALFVDHGVTIAIAKSCITRPGQV